MVKEKNCKINEEEAVRAFLMFRSFPSDKQAFAIAFMNGMEFQRSMDAEAPANKKIKNVNANKE